MKLLKTLSLFLFVTLLPAPLFSAPADRNELKPIFIFSEHFFAAAATLKTDQKYPLKGVFKTDRFLFRAMPGAEILSVQDPEKNRKVMRVPLQPPFVYGLRFSGITPAAQIRISYKLSQVGKIKDDSFVTVNVFCGKRLLKRFRFATTLAGEQTELVDLGPASFLNRNLAITFQISAEEAKEAVSLDFAAELLN